MDEGRLPARFHARCDEIPHAFIVRGGGTLLAPDRHDQQKEHTVVRMTFTPAIVLIALAASASLHAQQVNPAEALNQAKQTLTSRSSARLRKRFWPWKRLCSPMPCGS